MRRLGQDLALRYAGPGGAFDDADLELRRGRPGTRRGTDLEVASGVGAAEQMLANRLKTQRGELAPLGHPDYGSRHHELIGRPNVERTRNLIKLYVLQALADEPRVQKVLACVVYAPHTPPVSELTRSSTKTP